MTARRTRSAALTANAAGLVTALAFLAQEAQAAVQVFAPDPSPFSGSTPSFNPTTTDIINGFCATNLVKPYACDPAIMEYSASSGNSLEGLVQNSSTPFASGVTLTTSDVLTCGIKYLCVPNNGDHFFLGFAFRAFGSEDPYNLGWVEVSYESFTVSVYQWAYETVPGQSIEVGSTVPEPATTALATGGIALAGYLAAKRYKAKRLEKSA